jgi:hypothetical protein
MDLQKTAESESERRTRSKLEPHREAIFALRRKHWTYRQIAKWLKERGIPVTFPSVYRFCERAIARRSRTASPPPANPLDSLESEPLSPPLPPTTQTKKKYRFPIDI